jgi:hypothetical protein
MMIDLSSLDFLKQSRFEVNNIIELYSFTGLSHIDTEFFVEVEDAQDHHLVSRGSAVFSFNPRKYQLYSDEPNKYWELRNKEVTTTSGFETVNGQIVDGKLQISREPTDHTFLEWTVYRNIELDGHIFKEEVLGESPVFQIIDGNYYAVFSDSDYLVDTFATVKYTTEFNYLDGVRLSYDSYDTTPIIGSSNFVTSDGIARSLKTIRNEFDSIDTNSLNSLVGIPIQQEVYIEKEDDLFVGYLTTGYTFNSIFEIGYIDDTYNISPIKLTYLGDNKILFNDVDDSYVGRKILVTAFKTILYESDIITLKTLEVEITKTESDEFVIELPCELVGEPLPLAFVNSGSIDVFYDPIGVYKKSKTTLGILSDINDTYISLSILVQIMC